MEKYIKFLNKDLKTLKFIAKIKNIQISICLLTISKKNIIIN